MDEMKLIFRTKLMRGMIAKILSNIVFGKTGIRMNIDIENVGIEKVGESINFNLALKGDVHEKYLAKINRIIDENAE